MSIKGFSTQKKLDTELVGYNDAQSKDSNQFITAQKTSSDKVLLDSTTNVIFRLHPAVKTVEANSDKRIIKITGHGAKAGDVLRFETASQNPFFEAGILSVPDANTIILVAELTNTPSIGDEFYLLRYGTLRTDETGGLVVSVAPAPISFVLNGVDTEVEEDTGTPANSIPLPVKVLDASGVIVGFATATKQDAQTALLTTISTKDFATSAKQDAQTTVLNGINTSVGEISTNTLAIAQATARNTSGSVINGSLSATTANLETAPAGAIGFIVENESSNSNPIRYRIGGTASTSEGMLLEPGRDSGYVPTGTNVSICNTVSSTQTYSILWVIK